MILNTSKIRKRENKFGDIFIIEQLDLEKCFMEIPCNKFFITIEKGGALFLDRIEEDQHFGRVLNEGYSEYLDKEEVMSFLTESKIDHQQILFKNEFNI